MYRVSFELNPVDPTSTSTPLSQLFEVSMGELEASRLDKRLERLVAFGTVSSATIERLAEDLEFSRPIHTLLDDFDPLVRPEIAQLREVDDLSANVVDDINDETGQRGEI